MAKLTTEQLMTAILGALELDEPQNPDSPEEKALTAITGGRMTKAAKAVINHPECPIAILDCLDGDHTDNHLNITNRVRLNYGLDCPIEPVTITDSDKKETIDNPEFQEYRDWKAENPDLDVNEYYPDGSPSMYIQVGVYDDLKELDYSVMREFHPSQRQAVALEALKHGLIDESGSIYLSNWDCLSKFL